MLKRQKDKQPIPIESDSSNYDGSKEDKLEAEPKDITTFSNNDSSVVPSDSVSSTKKKQIPVDKLATAKRKVKAKRVVKA